MPHNRFDNSSVNLDILKQRAYNLRWATVPDGVIPLTAADPDFPVAPEITEALCRFAKDGYFCYGPPGGLPSFRESMAEYFRVKRLVPATAEHILPVDSAAYGIYLTCKAFLSPGDEAIVFDPVDFLFRYSVETVGARAVSFAIPAGKAVDFERLESLITKKTRLICLCNPLNPTGKVFTREELLEFSRIAEKHDLIILSDEIWSDIIFAPHQFTSIASLNEATCNRTITVTGFSKSYGLAGLRIGAVMAQNPAYFKLLNDVSLHQSTVHGVNILSQVAATTALTSCQYWLTDFLAHLQAMKTLMVSELSVIDKFSIIPPEGCYLAFVNISQTGRSSKEVHEILFNSARVAVVPGLQEWFGEGADGYIRMSFATSEIILREAIQRIKKTVHLL